MWAGNVCVGYGARGWGGWIWGWGRIFCGVKLNLNKSKLIRKNVWHSMYFWPIALKVGCIANFESRDGVHFFGSCQPLF